MPNVMAAMLRCVSAGDDVVGDDDVRAGLDVAELDAPCRGCEPLMSRLSRKTLPVTRPSTPPGLTVGEPPPNSRLIGLRRNRLFSMIPPLRACRPWLAAVGDDVAADDDVRRCRLDM